MITKPFFAEFIAVRNINLQPTQTKLCVPVINRIYRKLCGGIKFDGIKVADNLICDGHHRYIASLLANIAIESYPGHLTSVTKPIDWKLVIFEEQDWDTPAKIRMLNQQDADYNDIALEQIVELLK